MVSFLVLILQTTRNVVAALGIWYSCFWVIKYCEEAPLRDKVIHEVHQVQMNKVSLEPEDLDEHDKIGNRRVVTEPKGLLENEVVLQNQQVYWRNKFKTFSELSMPK